MPSMKLVKRSFKVKAKFTKIGNKIKYELPFKIYCHDMKRELPHTGTFDKNDGLYKSWIGDVNKAFKNTNIIYRKVNLIQIYDDCDKPIPVK